VNGEGEYPAELVWPGSDLLIPAVPGGNGLETASGWCGHGIVCSAADIAGVDVGGYREGEYPAVLVCPGSDLLIPAVPGGNGLYTASGWCGHGVVCSAADIAGVDVVVQCTGWRGARCAQVGGLGSIETCEQM